jgi:hypothetical protein
LGLEVGVRARVTLLSSVNASGRMSRGNHSVLFLLLVDLYQMQKSEQNRVAVPHSPMEEISTPLCPWRFQNRSYPVADKEAKVENQHTLRKKK